MSTLRVNTLANQGGTQSTAIENAINGSAKAWVNFNGTDTVAIRASYNVSSITDNDAGDYTVNFTNALANANYSLSGFAAVFANATAWVGGRPNATSGDFTTTSARVVASYQNALITDVDVICVQVFC